MNTLFVLQGPSRSIGRPGRAGRAACFVQGMLSHEIEAVMVRWLQQQGLQAGSFSTAYGAADPDAPQAEAGSAPDLADPPTAPD